MKILIAPWGDPSGWGKAKYIFNGVEYTSSTSLNALQEVIKPDKIIIIGLDTLAEKGKSYEELKKDAEEKIRKYAKSFELENFEVIIAPGKGTFSNGIFEGEMLDYYYYILAKVSLNLLETNANSLEVHLDLTHGINYSTILTYRAIKEIMQVFSIFKYIHFKAYNTDPWKAKGSKVQNATELPLLSINIVEDSCVAALPFSEKTSSERILEPINLTPKEREELFKNKLKTIKEINSDEISAFIGAFYNGLPLALFRFYPEKEKLKEAISNALNCYENYIETKSDGKLNVRRKVKFGRNFKVYVFAYVIATLLENFNLVSSRKEEVTIDEIKKLNDQLFKFDERLNARIEQDINRIEQNINIIDNNVKEEVIKNWKVYNEILKSIQVNKPETKKEAHTKGSNEERNFLAHSGFERNSFEVKKDDGKLLLRYCKDKIEKGIKWCQMGLK